MKYLFLALLLPELVSAAVVYGNVYDWSTFDFLQDAVVEVNSTPRQFTVAKNSSYSFDLPPGEYEIKANYFEDGVLVLTDAQTIVVSSGEGSYVLDLMLFPAEGVEGELIEGLDDVGTSFDDLSDEQFDYAPALFVLVAVVFIVFFIYWFYHKQRRIEPSLPQLAQLSDLVKQLPKLSVAEADLDSEAKEVLKKIRGLGGRVSQRELRKQLPYSEAKASLILAELESRGLLQKFKKGRGNLIVLKNA